MLMVRAWAVVAATMTQTQTSGNGLLNICIGVGKADDVRCHVKKAPREWMINEQ